MLERLAITQPNMNVYSETFIRNHIQYLGAYTKVHDLAGGWVPSHANGKPLLPGWVVWIEKAAARLLNRPFVHWFTAARVRRYLLENKIQMVLCEYGPGGVAMMPICKQAGIPFAVHFFGLDLHGKKLIRQYGEQYRKMFQEADLIIAISTLQQRVIQEMGGNPAKIRHIVCGADLTYLPEHFPEEKPPVFLAVGRMVEKKAPLLTLQAFAAVAAKHPQARLQYIGDGPLMPQCRRFVAENSLEDKVDFLLARKPDYIAQTLQRTLCFVQHSITASDGDSEGTPVAILDAGLAGVPVVSTRHAGIQDIVVDGETGLLVDEGDVAGMAACMERLLLHPAEALAMGRKASEHVQRHYIVSVTIDQLWDALQTAFARKKS